MTHKSSAKCTWNWNSLICIWREIYIKSTLARSVNCESSRVRYLLDSACERFMQHTDAINDQENIALRSILEVVNYMDELRIKNVWSSNEWTEKSNVINQIARMLLNDVDKTSLSQTGAFRIVLICCLRIISSIISSLSSAFFLYKIKLIKFLWRFFFS